MYFAPIIASSLVFTLSFKNFSTSFNFIGKDIIIFASGSKPFFIASVAFVFFFSLKGLYISSISTSLLQFIIFCLSSSVRSPFSSINLITSSFLFNKFTWYSYTSFIFLISSSFKLPVASFLYLAINGIVFPSPSSFSVASICFMLIFKSLLISFIISSFILHLVLPYFFV